MNMKTKPCPACNGRGAVGGGLKTKLPSNEDYMLKTIQTCSVCNGSGQIVNRDFEKIVVKGKKTYYKPPIKVLIIGDGRHGKDTLAEIWSEEFGLTFSSSSYKAAEIFIFDELKEKYGYKTFDECYEDRHTKRTEWFNLITEYNSEDKAKLAKDILKENNCYVGMRNPDEIRECIKQNIFDIIVFVDASERMQKEGKGSMPEDLKKYSDLIILNNDSLESFYERAKRVGKLIFN